MIEPDAYLPGESPELEYVYNNESSEEPVYWPLYYTQFAYKKDARNLYNDDPEDYIAYSGGWNTLFVTKQKDGRYKNISIRAVSGDSFGFYLSAGSLVDGIPTYYSGPLATSGSYSVLTKYSGEFDAQSNSILFTSPTDNSQVFTFPEISVVNFMRLHHSGEAYRLYQFLPRTLIQVDDLEADVIDAVTIRVSDSIVVSADDLADGSITGAKILAGTVSGVLITPGTITANELNVGQLDAIASNMGTLFVNSGITIGEAGFLWTGQSISGEVLLTKEGLSVDNSFAVGTELSRVGGGSDFLFEYVPRSRFRYYPSVYSGTSIFDFNYELGTYSGPETLFDMSAIQLGKQGDTSETFNGYASRIQTGYSPTSSGLRNDYAETTISTVASGESYLLLRASDVKENMTSAISMTAGNNGFSYLGGGPGTRVAIDSRELRVRTDYVNIKDTLTIYKDISQESPFIEFFSPILEVNETNFRYVDPKDSLISSPAVDLFVVNNSGNASLKNNLTVSGTITSLSGIFLNDSVDNSTIFAVDSSGLSVTSASGDQIVSISTSTGNLDILGGDFFVYNSVGSTIVASIDKTGVADFTASVTSPNFYVDANGTASLPSISWVSDTDTGIYRAGDGYTIITSNTVVTAGFLDGQIRATNGAIDAPAYSFFNDTDSGIYRSGGNIGFSLNGSLAVLITTNNVLSVNGTNQNGQITVEVPDGTSRNTLALRQLNDASNFINFVSNGVGAGYPTQTSALGSYYGKVRVAINGTSKWIAIYN